MSFKRNNTSWQRIVLTVICVILALVLVVLAGGTILLEHYLGKLGDLDETQNTLSSSQIDELTTPDDTYDGSMSTIETDYVVPTIEQIETTMPETEGQVINIMLIGQDRRPGQGRQRSDTMILCTVNTSKNTITFTSFLRDSYVAIPGYKDNKMNAAFAYGGADLLDQVLYVNYGVEVDGNVEVDFNMFTQVIDAVGGIDIEMTSEEAYHVNNMGDFSLGGGWNHLNGEEALMYARMRIVGGDWQRTGRQRKVMTALVDKVRGMNIMELNNLLNTLLPMISTDLSNAQIINYMLDLFPMLSNCTIKSQSIPERSDQREHGTWIDAYVGHAGSVIKIKDFEFYRQILRETMAIEKPDATGTTG